MHMEEIIISHNGLCILLRLFYLVLDLNIEENKTEQRGWILIDLLHKVIGQWGGRGTVWTSLKQIKTKSKKK